MNYQPYVKNTRSIEQRALIKIGVGGNIYLNTYTMRNYFNGVKFVILLYDEAKSSFAIKPVEKQVPHAYKLGFSSSLSKSTGVVAARGFVELPFIKKHKGEQKEGKWTKEDKFLEVKL